MKTILRTVAAITITALAAFGLTGCTDDDCDASGTTSLTLVAAPAHLTDGKGGGKSGKGKSKKGATVHTSGNCEDDH